MPYASVSIASAEGLVFTALSSGQWANGQLLVDVDVQGLDLSSAGDSLAFNLTIRNLTDGTTEYFPAVTMSSTAQKLCDRSHQRRRQRIAVGERRNGHCSYAADIACRTRDDRRPGWREGRLNSYRGLRPE